MLFFCYLTLFISLFLIIVIVFDLYPHIRENIQRKRMTVSLDIEEDVIPKRKQDLTLMEKIMIKIDRMLRLTGKDHKYLFTLFMAFFMMGFMIGLFIFEFSALAFIMAIVTSPLAILVLMLQSQYAIRKEDQELRNAMAVITNSYIATNDLVSAISAYVEEKNREGRVGGKKDPFERFLVNESLISASIERDLNQLADEIDNKFFRQWISTLILCQDDSSLKFALKPIINQLADEQEAKTVNDTQMHQVWVAFLSVCVLCLLIIPMFKSVEYSWYIVIAKRFLGKVLSALMMISMLVSASIIIYMQGKRQ